MDTKDLKNFKDGIEKNALVGKIIGKMFKRSKKPFTKRVRESGRNLAVTGSIMGAIGVGGIVHGSMKHGAPLDRHVMQRGRP